MKVKRKRGSRENAKKKDVSGDLNDLLDVKKKKEKLETSYKKNWKPL